MLLRLPVGDLPCCSCLLSGSRHLAGSLLLGSLHLLFHLLYLQRPHTRDPDDRMALCLKEPTGIEA